MTKHCSLNYQFSTCSVLAIFIVEARKSASEKDLPVPLTLLSPCTLLWLPSSSNVFLRKNTIAVFDLHCQQPRPLKLNLEQNNFLRLFTRLSGTSEILTFNPVVSIVLDFRPQTERRNAKC